MYKFKKQIAFLFGCIALITYLSIHFSSSQDSVRVVSTQKEGTHMQIYLKDEDRTLIPLSIPVSEELSEDEKLQLMFSYMSGKQSVKGFLPLFQKECTLQRVIVQKGIASLYLDDSFKNYKAEDELRVLEAITWGSTQFHDIEQVKLFQNDQPLTSMPVANTPIPEVLNRSIGINHFETSASSLHDSTSITVFATKKIEGNEYLVPRSRRIQVSGDSLSAHVNSIITDISASSELLQPLYADDIEVKDFKMQDGTLYVELNKNILSSDASVKQNVYDTLVLSLATLEGIQRVEVRVDGVVVTPKSQKAEAVSKYELMYNEVTF
ncbi:GerMN domain-containing protein [Amedibacillus sp. YH-ame10]